MEITQEIVEKEFIDYDFMFTTGSKLAISVDVASGDTVTELADRYAISIAAKKNPLNPEDNVDQQDLDVFKLGLAVVNRCVRKQRQPTEEELFDRRATIHRLAKNLQ